MEAAKLDTVMAALSDPTRRAVFERIAKGAEPCAGAVAAGLSVSQPAVSQHLKVLREAGLVAQRREGRLIRYRVEPQALGPLFDWLEFYGAFWRDRFADLRQTLKEIDP